MRRAGNTTTLQRLTCRGYPSFATEVQEELALQAFFWGLWPLRLREHVRLAEFINGGAEGSRESGGSV